MNGAGFFPAFLFCVVICHGCTSTEQATSTVGPAGGSLEFAQVALVVPEGALSGSTEISIREMADDPPSGHVAYSKIYRFEPEGLVFARPVTVSFSFSGDPASVAVFWTDEGAAEFFERLGGEVRGQEIVAFVTHFSKGFAGKKQAGAVDAGSADASAHLDAKDSSSQLSDGWNSQPMIDGGSSLKDGYVLPTYPGCPAIPWAESPQSNPAVPCTPGQAIWCDGLAYCGWGQAVCKPDGTWPTISQNGQVVLDCQELADGRSPDTDCACYHFYFNPRCCECPGCILPTGGSGRSCAPSAGNLCDYCNPSKPECTAPGAQCVVSNSHETFCGRECLADLDCPSGYTCMPIKLLSGMTSQCVPTDLSCFF